MARLDIDFIELAYVWNLGYQVMNALLYSRFIWYLVIFKSSNPLAMDAGVTYALTDDFVLDTTIAWGLMTVQMIYLLKQVSLCSRALLLAFLL